MQIIISPAKKMRVDNDDIGAAAGLQDAAKFVAVQ